MSILYSRPHTSVTHVGYIDHKKIEARPMCVLWSSARGNLTGVSGLDVAKLARVCASIASLDARVVLVLIVLYSSRAGHGGGIGSSDPPFPRSDSRARYPMVGSRGPMVRSRRCKSSRRRRWGRRRRATAHTSRGPATYAGPVEARGIGRSARAREEGHRAQLAEGFSTICAASKESARAQRTVQPLPARQPDKLSKEKATPT